ncbi:60Kd inner membrane protein-domain-containing protein [Polychytrium aggregatum]|uniref:60Kd inner membrane protein-domain-containing protein n=1 Tax=Polychytrium aggregatum TaxID=110093 RepID=UPI0022FE9E69|nr:60Kd inner membrane protein-domain-containing protein [Polychytrium aggregatum]KAI9202975.1 60Kd inner membrane protein-domain-containing protein [Polychytrium aggregatum]
MPVLALGSWNRPQRRHLSESLSERLASLSVTNPVDALADALISLQSLTGLPWYATIVISTVVLRSVTTLPLALVQRKRLGRLMGIAPIIKAWEETLKHQATRDVKRNQAWRTAEQGARSLQKQYQAKLTELYRIHNCHPLKTFLVPWVQLPLFVSMSFALRKLTAFPLPWMDTPPQPAPGIVEGGLGWFVDLSAADPTMIFPVFIGLCHLTTIQLNTSKLPLSGRAKVMRAIFRGLAIVSIPIAANVPMAVVLYWATSGVFSLVQIAIFRYLKL